MKDDMSNLEYRLFYRRNLPHYQPANATLFVTFRLAGSLPVEVLQRLREEYEHTVAEIDPSLELRERNKLEYTAQRWLFGRMDRFLDAAGTGPRWLQEQSIAELLVSSLHFRHGRIYNLDTFCVMPNHVHVVFAPLKIENEAPNSLSSIMQSLKGYTARKANQILEREGAFWHHESYDHVVRDAAEHERIVRYILNNPVKAGLVADRRDWPWNYTIHQL